MMRDTLVSDKTMSGYERSSMSRLASLHVDKARLLALRIHSYATAVYPSDWMESIVENASIDLIEFAFHAYRINEICSLKTHKFDPITTLPVKISENDPGDWESNYQRALNTVRYATSIIFGNIHLDHRQLFLSSHSNLAPLYIRASTDKVDQKSISMFGVTYCFLTEVIPLYHRWVDGKLQKG